MTIGRSSRGSCSATGLAARGGMCLTVTDRGRRCGNGTPGFLGTGPGTRCCPGCWPRPTPRAGWTGRSRLTPPARGSTNTAPLPGATQGAQANYKNPLSEPDDHGIGRSRGGLTSKIHGLVDGLVDGQGRPLVLLVTAGNINDSPVFPALLEHLSVDRLHGGRPRTRPDSVAADKAYSARAHRAELRRRHIRAVIPQPADQIANRKRRGRSGGRPPRSTPPPTAAATSSNAPSTASRTGAAWPAATTSTPSSGAAEPS